MPNYCDYEMKVVGNEESIKEFIKVMNSNYNYHTMEFDFDRHMGGRVFEANAGEIVNQEDGKFNTTISGYCAWSVWCCMFDGAHTYYNDFKKYGAQNHSTTLIQESGKLNLDIEVYSEESGMCFQEHYLIKQGILEINEEREWNEYCICDYETKEEAEEELEIKITDNEWKNEEYISRGGFEEWSYEI